MFILSGILIYIAKPSESKKFSPFIAVCHLQLLACLTKFSVRWPSTVSNTFDVLSILNLNLELFSTECASSTLNNYFSRWALKASIPFVFGIAFLIIYLVLKLLQRLGDTCRIRIPSSATDNLGSRMIRASVAALSFAYTLLISISTEFFNCVKQPDGSYTLAASPATRCYESQWNRTLPAAILAFIFYGIAIPAIFLGILIYHRRRNLTSSNEFWLRYSGLTRAFSDDCWYYEVINVLRSGILVAAIDFLSPLNDPMITVNVAISFTLIFLLLINFLQPYQSVCLL